MSGLAGRRLSSSIWTPALLNQVYHFWFAGVPAGATAPPPDVVKRWFGGAGAEESAKFDSECDSQFRHALDDISPDRFPLPEFVSYETDRRNAGEIAAPFRALESFRISSIDERARAGLGLVLLLDQMTRNIFRKRQALIYGHYDRLSRAVVESMLTKQDASQDPADVVDIYGLQRASDTVRPPVRQTWFYVPFMHSEDVATHDRATQAITELRDMAQAENDQGGADWLQNFLGFEAQHRAIMDRFHRYPYRNEFLGRETTEEERKWLEEGGQRFGS